MTDIKSLLKKAELFERLAIYGGRKAFLNSIAQTISSGEQFDEARKFLQLAKDTIKGDMLSQLGNRVVTLFAGLKSAPSDIASLKSQLATLNDIRRSLYAQSGGDQYNEPAARVALEMGRYLSKAQEIVSEIMSSPSNQEDYSGMLANMQRSDVKSDSYTGKPSDRINPSTQLALNQLFPELKLKADGFLGPQTGQALQLYKNQYKNTKNTYDPSLHQDVINSAKDKKSGLIRNTPF